MEPPSSSGQPAAAPKWTSKEVAAYLARWGVETAVQEAINSAIKHKAPDPVLYVADFLEQKGHEMEAPAPAAEAPPQSQS